MLTLAYQILIKKTKGLFGKKRRGWRLFRFVTISLAETVVSGFWNGTELSYPKQALKSRMEWNQIEINLPSTLFRPNQPLPAPRKKSWPNLLESVIEPLTINLILAIYTLTLESGSAWENDGLDVDF